MADPNTDPLAGIGTPVDSAPPASTMDPLAGIGTPVDSAPAPQPGLMTSIANRFHQAGADAATALQNHPVLSAINDIVSAPENASVGALKMGAQGIGGMMKILGEYGVVPVAGAATPNAPDAGLTPNQKLKEAGDWLMQNNQLHGFWQHAGGAGELIGEVLSPMGVEETAERGLTLSQRLTQQAKTAQFLADHPTIAQMAAVGARVAHATIKPVVDTMTRAGEAITGASEAVQPVINTIPGRAAMGAVRGAGEAGAQTFVHTGGDVGQTETAAAAGGVGGAILTPVAEGLSYLANRAMPAVEDLFGEPVQTLASQRPGVGTPGGVGIESMPAVQQAQQAAAPNVFRNIAQRATYDALEEANQTRLAGLPADTTPPQFTIRGAAPETTTTPPELIPQRNQQYGRQRVVYGPGAADQPNVQNIRGPYPLSGIEREGPSPPVSEIEQMMLDAGIRPVEKIGSRQAAILTRTEGPTRYHMEPMYQIIPPRLEPGGSTTTAGLGGGDFITNSPELAQMHLNTLNDVLDNPPKEMYSDTLDDLTAQRDELQAQLNMHHFTLSSQIPGAPRVNSPLAAKLVNTFGDAHDQMQQAIGPYMQRINQETGGAANGVLNARATALRRGDLSGFFDADRQLDTLIDNSTSLNPNERAQVNTLRDKARVMGALDTAVQHAANVEDASAAQVRGGRVLMGQRLGNSLDSIADRFGGGNRARGVQAVSNVIGDDGWAAMRRMQDLLSVPQTKKDFLHVAMTVAHTISRGAFGGLAGAMLGHATGIPEGGLMGAAAGAYAQRAALRWLATSPRALNMADFAVRNFLNPETAAAAISAELLRERGSPMGTLNRTAQTSPSDVINAATGGQ
jgi:hypothetical protein